MVDTLDLNGNDESMTPLDQPPPPPAKTEPEKNIDKEVNMDSTPISDLMGQHEVMEHTMMAPPPQMVPGAAMAMAPQVQQTQQAPVQAVQAVQAKYPGNLTEEQVESLIVAFSAVLAFSKITQEKIANIVPNFLDAEGSRTMIGMIVTGLIAAIIFYFTRRFIIKN